MLKPFFQYWWQKLRGHHRLRELARHQVNAGQFELAERAVQLGQKRFPRSVSFEILRARMSLAENCHDAVKASLTRIESLPNQEWQDRFETGELYRNLQVYSKAISFFEVVAGSNDPTMAAKANQVLTSLYLRLGKPLSALSAAIASLEQGGWHRQQTMLDLANHCADSSILDAIGHLETIRSRSEYLNANRLKMIAYLSLQIGERQKAIHSIREATRSQFRVEHPDLNWDESQSALRPSFLIIGAMKSGTTAIFNHLARHPDVVTPLDKELHFFEHRDWPREFYLAQFPRVSTASRRFVTGEASPGYYALNLATRVRAAFPDVKIIFIQRNPVDRAISHLFHNHRNALEEHPSSILTKGQKAILEMAKLPPERFCAALEEMEMGNLRINRYLLLGCYDLLMKSWYNAFPKSQILTLEFEEFSRDPQPSINQVFEFLGLSRQAVVAHVEDKAVNAGYYRPNTPELAAVRRQLKKFYADASASLASVSPETRLSN